MPLSRPCLRLLCPHLVLLLAGLVGCAPASPDTAPGVESRASISTPSLSEQSPAPGIHPAANPGSLASENEAGTVGDQGVPASTSNELASPTVPLEIGAQAAPPGAVDPLSQAVNDQDEHQRRAEALLEEHEYQDPDEGQDNQHPDEGYENQDPNEKGET